MHPRAVLGVSLAILCLILHACGGEAPSEPAAASAPDHRSDLRSVLQALSDGSADPIFRLHFASILRVIEAGDRRSAADTTAIEALWRAFDEASSVAHSPRREASYLDRSRPLVVSWVSPTDGQVSFAWLTLPARWSPAEEYPLYVQLHGMWDVAQDRLPYLAYPFSNPGSSFAFEDGYLVAPWGRGNLWYRGIAETDFWEGLAAVKALFRVQENRQYLCGHSMGGYGAWHIGHRSADVWAALGIHAGALWYDPLEVSTTVAMELRDIPTYFVVGTYDSLLTVNVTAHAALREAGNANLSLVTFPGGHEYRQQDVERMYLWMREFERSAGRGAALATD